MNSELILRRNSVIFSGQGRTALVFAHGFGCDQKLWRFVAPAFEEDFRVVRFDYVGAGRSEAAAYDPARYASLEGYVQDLIEVITAAGLREVVFVGHSVSGVVGLLASIRRPELFARLVLVCPSPRYLNDGPDYVGGFERADIEGLLDLMEKNPSGWAGFLAPLVMKNADRPELGAELETSFCAMKPEVARQFARVTFFSDNRDDLAQVTTPTLILQCAEDAVAPEAVGRFMHARLTGSTYHALRATGHCPHVSHPEETIAAIRGYLVGAGALAQGGGRMSAVAPEAGFDDVPCGWLRVADDGRILATNATLRALTGAEGAADAPQQIEALLTPAAKIYYQLSLFPGLRLAGAMDEIYLTLRHAGGGEIPVLVNARRREVERCSDWAVVRIEQRGRWEAEVLQAKRIAEEASRASAQKSEELGAAKRELERTLAELKESNWMLRKAAEVLPTCMYCSRVKGDQAQWQSAIDYLKKNAVFLSHGCCPDCTVKFLADLGLDPEDGKNLMNQS